MTSTRVYRLRQSLDTLARRAGHRLEVSLGGATRTRVVVVLACALALSSADTATVGASATQLRQALHISNTDIGLLVAVTSLTGAIGSLPFGVLADRVNRTRTLALAVAVWGGAMIWSATVSSFGRLLMARLFLGLVTAAAGPVVASLIGDYFPGSERGRIYSYVLSGELLGAGLGFAVTGDIAALSWRAAFIILAIPTFILARYIWALPEPVRGGARPLVPDLPGVAGGPSVAGTPPPAAAGFGPGEAGPAPFGADGNHHQQGEPAETDAQRLARERGIEPDANVPTGTRLRQMGLWSATRYVMSVRTNVILIVASALGYFYLSGVQTFGVEFVTAQYRVNQVLADGLLLVIGVGAVAGVLLAGRASDSLLARNHINARIAVAAAAATATAILFIPALITRSVFTALPYLIFAAFALSAQNPPIDAARLDIMPAPLWGRAEGIRTFLRTIAQSTAPLLFGAISDYVFGGGRSGLQWTFVIMLLPLAGNAFYLWRAMRTYPRDVASAAAAMAGGGGGRPVAPRSP